MERVEPIDRDEAKRRVDEIVDANADELIAASHAIHARPELLKPTGTGGAGVRQSNAGSGGGKTMTRSQFESATPADRMAHAKAGGQVVDG